MSLMPASKTYHVDAPVTKRDAGVESPMVSTRSDIRLAWRLATARLHGQPVVLSHLITRGCNARCATCLWRLDADATSYPGMVELTSEEIAWLYRQAGAAGFPELVVWGGEPLLRPDLPELLRVAASAGLSVTLITNGWLLAQRWPSLRGRVHTLIVSLDDVGDAHDRLRSLPGLYSRLEEFVGEIQDDPLRPRLLVNTVLSRLNRGALRRVAPVAKRWGAGLYFCPMETGVLLAAGPTEAKANLALSPQELREAAQLARELRAAGYPLRATGRYLGLLESDAGVRAYDCRFPRAILTVKADGSIRDCTRRDVVLATLADLRRTGTSLSSVVRSPEYRAMLARADVCTACNNPDVVETSWAWQLRPFMLLRALRLGLG
jgi:MoaA/NifB/PqqE/SkfB family radical SAM enzyme